MRCELAIEIYVDLKIGGLGVFRVHDPAGGEVWIKGDQLCVGPRTQSDNIHRRGTGPHECAFSVFFAECDGEWILRVKDVLQYHQQALPDGGDRFLSGDGRHSVTLEDAGVA